MATFTSAFLGEVQHPKNTLHEYLTTFRNKCQADILSWLDNWTRTKRSQGKEDWIWLVTSKLATELGYCKDTIIRHLDKLLNLGVIDRKKALRWSCDQAYEYRIVSEKLSGLVQQEEKQTIDSLITDHPQSDNRPSIVQNPTTYTNSCITHTELTHTTNSAAVEEKQIEEQPHEETRGRNSNVVDDSCSPPTCSGLSDGVLHPLKKITKITEDSSTPGITDEASPSAEEIKDVEIELRRLSPDININPQVKSAIRSFWHNVPAGLARVKTAIAQGWCKQPTGLFVQTLKNGASRDEEAVVVTKEYPRPTLEQLNQLGELGELVYTKFNEPGYPEVLTIKILGKNELLPWWVVLGICLEPE